MKTEEVFFFRNSANYAELSSKDLKIFSNKTRAKGEAKEEEVWAILHEGLSCRVGT